MRSWGDADGAGARPAPGAEPPDRLPEWRSAGDRSPSRFARAPDGGTPSPPPALRPGAGPEPTGGQQERRRRAFLATLGATLAVLAVTSPVAVLADDAVGDALGVRYEMPDARAENLVGQHTTELSIPTTPGEQMYVTAPSRARSTVGCRILDGEEWTPLPRLATGRDWAAWFTGGSSRRRGGFLGRMSTSRIHEFLVVEDVTTLRCDAARVGTGIEVWREGGGRHAAYRAVTWAARGLWLAAGTSLLWGPLLVRRLRHRPARAAAR